MSRHGTLCWMIVASLTVALAVPGQADAKRRKKRRGGKKAAAAAGPAALTGDAAKFDRMAKKAYVKQAYDDAVAAFELAYKADPRPKFLFNIGRCYEKKGDLPKAMEWVSRYRDLAGKDDDRSQADDLLALLEVKLRTDRSVVSITTTPVEAVIRLRGDADNEDGLAPFRRWMAFGVYELEVSKAGYDTMSRTVAVKAGTPVTIDVELQKTPEPKPQPPAPAPVVAAAAAPAKPRVASASKKVAEAALNASTQASPVPPPSAAVPEAGGWAPMALLGGAGAAMVGGLVFGTLSSKSVAERDALKEAPTTFGKVEELDSAARRHALVSNILLGVGAAAGLTGGVLWLLDDAGGASASVSVAPVPAGWGLTLSGAL